jgi:hypothetical protein
MTAKWAAILLRTVWHLNCQEYCVRIYNEVEDDDSEIG